MSECPLGWFNKPKRAVLEQILSVCICMTEKRDILRTGIKRRLSIPNPKTKNERIKRQETPERNLKNATGMGLAVFLPPLLFCCTAAGHRLLQCFARCRASSNTLSRKDGALPNSALGCQASERGPKVGVARK